MYDGDLAQQRTVLLIGWRPDAVKALERLGAEVTCVLATSDDTRERALLLDDAHTVPVRDPSSTEETLAGLERCGMSAEDFDVVCSQFEFTLVNGAIVGGARSGTTPQDALALRDKDLQKRRIRAAGIPVADFRLIVHAPELRHFPHARGVLKPLANSATRGVHAWRGEDERAALARHLEEAGALGPWLAEEWVDGPELHVDGVVRGGQVLFTSVGRYVQNVLAIRDGGIVASVMEHPRHRAGLYDRARAVAEQAMKALGHHDGVFHMEVFEQGDRLVFGECGGRIPGGSFDEMIRLQHGVDLHEEWARAVLGLAPTVAPAPAEQWYGDVFLATDAGTLRSFPGEREVSERDGVRHVVLTARPGDTLGSGREASCTFAGTAVVEGPDPWQTGQRLRDLARWFAANTVVTPEREKQPMTQGASA
ncbi:acetyl-CoA carboxylase biotin carboxylase subunit family protein [Streptomyces sp. NPDC007905]|uniref:ATP-grasp domain-containing protein n=1 Tax=Streptomyces sp. NPDC007905 TaxID=3364788 RepID=UPI0036F085B7